MESSIRQKLHELKIPFKSLTIYIESLTHPSFTNENPSFKSYQRLEFLGDALLEMAVSEYIFSNYKNFEEGEMTILRASAVSGKTISKLSLELGFDKLILVGNKSDSLKTNEKILADVFESFVAAIFLDLGIKFLNYFLENTVFKFIAENANKEQKNPKTILQEFLQAESRENIMYLTEKKDNYFESTIFHDGNNFGLGQGKTKKEAEIEAAKNALKLLSKAKINN